MRAILKILIISSTFPIIFSCRQVPLEENIQNGDASSENPISVKINFLGIDLENNSEKTPLFLKNNSQAGKGNPLKTKGLDINTHYIDDFSFLDVKEISNTPEDNEYLASIGLSASVKGEDLPNGAEYTVLAYKKIGDAYILHKQRTFKVGKINSSIELDEKQNYTLIIVSSGGNISYKVNNANDIDYVNISQSTYNERFLYQKIENLIPIGNTNNILNIKLKESPRISVIVDISELLGKNDILSIEDMENVKITYQKPKLVKLFDLIGIEYETVTLPIKKAYFLDHYKMRCKIDFYNAFSVDNNKEFKFYADIKVKDRPDIGKITGLVLPVKSWHKYTFTLKPMVCGAYTGQNKTNFREFMCHDLGDGYTGVWTDKVIGNIYAWGKKDIVYQHVNNPYGEFGNWEESENPCPSGFRVPTIPEWNDVLNKSITTNTHEKLMNGDDVIGWKIGERLVLFTYNNYNPREYLWSSNEKWDFWSTAIDMKDSLRDWEVYSIRVREDAVEIYGDRKHYGHSVRCIKKLPYD